MPDFTHLHVHSQFSILDGAASIDGLLNKAMEYNMDALALTDHGNLYGVLKFVKAAEKLKKEKGYSIKPIIGCEIYVARRTRLDKKTKEDRSGHHLILLAKNLKGYRNLSILSSLGFKKEHFYYRPRIDKELLRKHHEGLIASSACLGGEIPSTILKHGEEKAEAVLQQYLDIFGDDFYLELQNHGLPEQKIVNKSLLSLASKYNVKVIATNDVHFINKEDYDAHHILICLNTGKDYDSKEGLIYSGQEYLKSPEEMAGLFIDYPEVITNTREIVDKIEEYKITTDKTILPAFSFPQEYNSEIDYLKFLTYEGAKSLYPEITPEIRERIDYELSILDEKGFAGYFLIVQDFVKEAKKMNVLVGPGRGSAAGSAIAYCTGITSVDPIKYNLLFERFLNPERTSMPDIDIDFDDEGREKVLDYVVQKYGKDRVAQIITFGTMAARSSIRDVGRVLKLPLDETDRLAKMVPDDVGITLSHAFKKVTELADMKRKGPDLVRRTLAFAEVLEGCNRHISTHACGVIIGSDNLIDYLPLASAKDSDLMVTQYEGKLVEEVGMLKMDFLGLKTLSIIKDALDNIYKRHGEKIDIESIPLDDKKTFELYQHGNTIGTFQFESDGMRGHLKELKPTHIEDLIAMNALYRPGPMQFIGTYVKRKHGKEAVVFPHPLLQTILGPTYGIMIYQEQIMQTAQIIGGFSLGQADILRRAMGKKKMDVMKEQRVIFLEGAKKNNIDNDKAGELFDLMEEFAKYGFNRSHSAAYSMVAYQTAYLKAH
ncbi:MAG: DNA polymerase III subunit alpha, partial [Bacteroidales bacterium]|nr:DNA polymerase III subunit alpha [Bacteroidales bacterium]